MITGAGALFFNIPYDDVTSATTKAEFAAKLQAAQMNMDGSSPNIGTALGGTSGGCTVTLTGSFRDIEIDDLTQSMAGTTIQDGWETATISTTAVEAVLEKIQQVMNTSSIDPTDGSLRFGSKLLPEHFDNEITLAVRTIGDNLLVFRLQGAVNRAGFTLTTTSGGEGSYPVEFHGHLKTLADIQAGFAPLRVYEFSENVAVIGAGLGGDVPFAAATEYKGRGAPEKAS